MTTVSGIIVDAPGWTGNGLDVNDYDTRIGALPNLQGWFTARANKATLANSDTELQALANRKTGATDDFQAMASGDRPLWKPTDGPNGRAAYEIGPGGGEYLQWDGYTFDPTKDFTFVAIFRPLDAAGSSYTVIGNKGTATNAGAKFRVFSDNRIMWHATSAGGANETYCIREGDYSDQWVMVVGTWDVSEHRLGLSLNGDEFTFASNASLVLADAQISTRQDAKIGTRFADFLVLSGDLSGSAYAGQLALLRAYAQDIYGLSV